MLDRDRRDQRLGPVAARHAEAIGPARDGVARELLEIEAVVEHDGLDAELRGEVDESEALDLPAAGPRVAEQHRSAGRSSRAHLQLETVEIREHRGARGRDHHGEQDDHEHAAQRDAIRAVERPRDRDHDRDEPEDHADDADGLARHALGDDPPRTRRRDEQPAQREDEVVDVAEQDAGEDEGEHDEGDDAHERRHPPAGRHGSGRGVQSAPSSMAASAASTLG